VLSPQLGEETASAVSEYLDHREYGLAYEVLEETIGARGVKLGDAKVKLERAAQIMGVVSPRV
jgi:hypothetical protein